MREYTQAVRHTSRPTPPGRTTTLIFKNLPDSRLIFNYIAISLLSLFHVKINPYRTIAARKGGTNRKVETIDLVAHRLEALGMRVEALADRDREHEAELRGLAVELKEEATKLSARLEPIEKSHKVYMVLSSALGYFLKLVIATAALFMAFRTLKSFFPS